MELLDEGSEKLLKRLLDASDDDSVFLSNIENINQSELNNLYKSGFIDSHNQKAVTRLTQKAKCYFEDKEKYLKQQRQIKIIDYIKYGITTFIALAALIVSIIAICKK
jgi:ABC-type taurine transport system substrate-binding protein